MAAAQQSSVANSKPGVAVLEQMEGQMRKCRRRMAQLKTTKAERRAMQEAQGAAKAANKAEKEEEIAKNLKKYNKKYEVEDQDLSMLLSEQDHEKRKMLKEEWARWISEWKRLHEKDKMERQKLRDGEASDEEEEYELKEMEIEELLNVSEEVIYFD